MGIIVKADTWHGQCGGSAKHYYRGMGTTVCTNPPMVSISVRPSRYSY